MTDELAIASALECFIQLFRFCFSFFRSKRLKCEDNNYKTASKHTRYFFTYISFFLLCASLSTIKESYTIRYLISLANRFESESRREIKRSSCPLIELFRFANWNYLGASDRPGIITGGVYDPHAYHRVRGRGLIHLCSCTSLWRRYGAPPRASREQ